MSDLPYSNKVPCSGCKATDYQTADLSPADFKPVNCDRCPKDAADFKSFIENQSKSKGTE